MAHIIALAGKGGTGKTTFAGLMIRALKEEDAGSILAIDADPNSNLGQRLGMSTSTSIVEIMDDISRNPDQVPSGMSKDRYIDLKVQESLDEGSGFDLLSMGRPEGPGCYCFANNMLRELITKLMKSYAYVVIDNEAGMEHLSRRLVRSIDQLFIVSDNSVTGIRSAARISTLVDELKIKVKNRHLVLNRSKDKGDALKEEIEKTNLSLSIVLPEDKEIEQAAIADRSAFELDTKNALLRSIKDMLGVEVLSKGR